MVFITENRVSSSQGRSRLHLAIFMAHENKNRQTDSHILLPIVAFMDSLTRGWDVLKYAHPQPPISWVHGLLRLALSFNSFYLKLICESISLDFDVDPTWFCLNG